MDIEGKLRRAWMKTQLIVSIGGLELLLGSVSALLLLDLLVDWLFKLGGPWRIGLLASNGLIIGAVLYVGWLRRLRRFDPVRIALRVERIYPHLEDILVTYVQLGEADDPHTSPHLIRAVRRRAEEMTRGLDFSAIASFKELKRPTIVAVGLIALFSIAALTRPQFVAVLLHRLAHPSSNLAYPSQTLILSVTGDLVVKRGSPVKIALRCGGRVPEEAELLVRFEGGEWEALKLERRDEGEFERLFERVFRSFSYYVRAGDAVSRTYRVRVVPPPRIVQAKIRLLYPEYTGLGEREAEELSLAVPEGTRVEWKLRLDAPVSEAYMIADGKPMPMKVGSDGRSASISLTISSPLSYSFRWRERSSGFLFDEEARYLIDLIPDEPPRVEIVRPKAARLKGTPRKELRLIFRATDDYGLKAAWVVYSVNGGPEGRYLIGSLEGRAARGEVRWKLSGSIPNLKPGDEVRCAIEVADNRRPEANRGRSRTVRISILSIGEYLKWASERRKALMREMRSLYEKEDESSDKVKELRMRAAQGG